MFWWFVSILVVAFDICFNILGDGRDLGMVLCHSVNAGSVVGTLDYPMKKNCLNFLYSQAVERKKLWAWALVPRRHLVKLSCFLLVFLAANRCNTWTSANHASTGRQGLISAFSDTTNVSQSPHSFWQVPPFLGLNVSGHKSHGWQYYFLGRQFCTKTRVLYFSSHVCSPNKPTVGVVVVATGLVTVWLVDGTSCSDSGLVSSVLLTLSSSSVKQTVSIICAADMLGEWF